MTTKRYITELLKEAGKNYWELRATGMDHNSAAAFSDLRGQMQSEWPELSMMSTEFDRLEQSILERMSV